jgi:molecular chaperone IbpA
LKVNFVILTNVQRTPIIGFVFFACPAWEGVNFGIALKEDNPMRGFDFAPLYRASVGFDQMADLMDRVLTNDSSQPSYPPYNIEKTGEDAWRISIAVAGFTDEELSVEARENSLIVAARRAKTETETTYLHRGIATRAFERRFHLADHVRVTAASHANGMLNIDLQREVPEALKPRQISISSADTVETKVVAQAEA